jgi:UDP-N-acetyl-D-galactosamine dehydrogenase
MIFFSNDLNILKRLFLEYTAKLCLDFDILNSKWIYESEVIAGLLNLIVHLIHLRDKNKRYMHIGIIGQGYVGLPLACLLATRYRVTGFDNNASKIQLLRTGVDYTEEVGKEALRQSNLRFSNDPMDLKLCNILIVAVPTDIDDQNHPDLLPLLSASVTIGAILQPGMTIVYESTVYPGLTEEECIPVLEKTSGLQWKKDFFVGYSPERVNPGDKDRPLHKILKIVSGDTAETLEKLSLLYGSVIEAGIYKAPDIRTAEAAKVIENAQRDLNIAFMNELAIIFDRMGLDTREVLKAASTKWNFLPFEPGLVGGHCIGVDPYYLTYKAELLGYTPQIIHSGRYLNNQMGNFIAEKVVKTLIIQEKIITRCRVLVLGCSFKENVGDARNSKVFDIVDALNEYHIWVDIIDPHVCRETNITGNRGSVVLERPVEGAFYDSVILAVKHDIFSEYTLDRLHGIAVNGNLNLFDVKAFYDRDKAQKMCLKYWRL